jgi:hypothetical protein
VDGRDRSLKKISFKKKKKKKKQTNPENPDAVKERKKESAPESSCV